MIAPMKKAYVVILERERKEALRALGRLGLVHLEPIAGSGAEFDEAARRIDAAARAIGLLGSLKAPKGTQPCADRVAARKLIADVNRVEEELRTLQDESQALAREIERVAGWGEFDPAAVAALKEAGVELRLLEGPAARLGALPEGLEFLRLAAPKGLARLAFRAGPTQPPPPAEFQEFALPARPLSAMRDRVSAIAREIAGREGFLENAAASMPLLKQAQKALVAEHRFEAFRSGMEAEGPLCHLKGWLPAETLPALRKIVVEQGWGLLADEPAADEAPPTKMRNSALVRLVEPIFDFLGTTPGYREYDISAWFLLFFCFFFAMIFGDAGYGSVMLAGGAFLAIKAKRAGKTVPDLVRLLLLLATCTLGYGTVTGTWFGIVTDRLPAFLRALMIPAIAGNNPTSPETIKVICFVMGTIQISIAHVKNIIRDFPNPKFLAQAGWLVVVVGLYFVVLNLVLDPAKYPIPGWALISIATGFFLVFLFGNWDGHLGKSVLAGLGGLLTQFLGTVSALADIISYIRLFAVGLAGVAIAQTVNSMGGGALGSLVGALAGVLILAFGHTLNLAMSVLSVIVHGIRLNMLEFSGHLGMEWAGYKYEPFTGVAEESAAEPERSGT